MLIVPLISNKEEMPINKMRLTEGKLYINDPKYDIL